MILAENISEDYELGELLGASSHSRVYRALDLVNNREVALKHVFPSQNGLSIGVFEVSSLLSIFHKNVVKCLDFRYFPDRSCAIVYEFVSGGSLRNCIIDQSTRDFAFWKKCAKDLLLGLEHLHEKRLIHCDLKPENLLIDFCGSSGEPTLKIADLGTSRFNESKIDTRLTVGVGSPGYMAPEAFLGRPVFQSDLYSVGIILYEMASGDRPFSGGVDSLARQHTNAAPCFEKIENTDVRLFVSSFLQKHLRDRLSDATSALRLFERVFELKIELSSSEEEGRAKETLDEILEEPTRSVHMGGISENCVIARFPLDHSLENIELLEYPNADICVACIHEKQIELLDARNGDSLNCFIPKINQDFQIIQGYHLIVSDPYQLSVWGRGIISPLRSIALGGNSHLASLSRDGRRVVWVDRNQVSWRNLDGLAEPCILKYRFTQKPTHIIHTEKGFAVISGTHPPSICFFDAYGEFLSSIRLPGPVLETSSRVFNAVVCCCFEEHPLNRLEVCFFDSESIFKRINLGTNTRCVAFSDTGVIYGSADNELRLASINGGDVLIGPLDPKIDSIKVSSTNQYYLAAEVSKKTRKLSLYRNNG